MVKIAGEGKRGREPEEEEEGGWESGREHVGEEGGGWGAQPLASDRNWSVNSSQWLSL